MDYFLAVEYFIFVLISSFFTIQIASSVKDGKNLRILQNRNLSIMLSLAVITVSFLWFFTTRDRSVPTYMEGAQISGVFVVGAFFSIILTKILKKIYEIS